MLDLFDLVTYDIPHTTHAAWIYSMYNVATLLHTSNIIRSCITPSSYQSHYTHHLYNINWLICNCVLIKWILIRSLMAVDGDIHFYAGILLFWNMEKKILKIEKKLLHIFKFIIWHSSLSEGYYYREIGEQNEGYQYTCYKFQYTSYSQPNKKTN